MERLYDLWAKRNPQWETRYEKELLRQFTDYGRGSSQYQDARGKTFGAGYELYIIAFFIGLYANQTKPLVEDASKRKGLVSQSNTGATSIPGPAESHTQKYVNIYSPH